INSNFAGKHRSPRDIRINFVKRSIKDKILKETNDKPLVILDKEVTLLKEIPKSIREIRNQYRFLTDKLNRYNIRFKWLIPEGILVNWKSKNIKLETVEEAENFDRQHFSKGQPEGGNPPDENSREGTSKNIVCSLIDLARASQIVHCDSVECPGSEPGMPWERGQNTEQRRLYRNCLSLCVKQEEEEEVTDHHSIN
ncbi:hypothetical protein JRQ81_019190, partial [Phrynocephalus forsythii]